MIRLVLAPVVCVPDARHGPNGQAPALDDPQRDARHRALHPGDLGAGGARADSLLHGGLIGVQWGPDADLWTPARRAVSGSNDKNAYGASAAAFWRLAGVLQKAT